MSDANKRNSDESDKWKEKYLSSLDDFEALESDSEQESALLKEGISKVCIAAQGQDTELDIKLTRLRELLRRSGKGSDREGFAKTLNAQLKSLESQLVTFDDLRRQRISTTQDAFEQLVTQLNPVAANKSERNKLGKLLSIIETSRQSDVTPDITEWMLAFAALQGNILNTGEDSSLANSSKATGFWQRFFGIADKADSTTTTSDSPDSDSPDSTTLATDSPSNDTVHSVSEEDSEFTSVSEEVSSVLLALLEYIDVDENNTTSVSALRKQLGQTLTVDNLIPTLESINAILIQTFEEHQNEFERFLKNLDRRLHDIHQNLDDAQDRQNAVTIESEKLDANVRSTVQGLQEDVNNATDLDQLKQSVRQNMDSIVASMDKFKEVKSNQEPSLAEQLTKLVDRVAMMERESTATQEQLEEQRQKVYIDHLTELPNRGAYDKRLTEEYSHWQRYRRPLTLVVTDIDHFKRINDNYGHSSGDKVLQVISKKLSKRLRKTDFVARYGGEEFAFLLPETNEEQALRTMEQLREAIEKATFQFRDERLEVTMSFGITEFRNEDTIESAFDRTDKALYKAKNEGRNRCIIADE